MYFGLGKRKLRAGSPNSCAIANVPNFNLRSGTRKESLPAAGVAVPGRNKPGSAETPRPPLCARCCRRHHHHCRRHAGQHRPLRCGRRLPALLPRWPPLPPPPPQRERTVPPRQRCSSRARRTQALPTRNRELSGRLCVDDGRPDQPPRRRQRGVVPVHVGGTRSSKGSTPTTSCMDDDSVYVIDPPSSPEVDDDDGDEDYVPAAPSRKAGTKGRKPAAKAPKAPRRKTPVVIDLVSPAESPVVPVDNPASKAALKPGRKRKVSLPDYIPLEGPLDAAEAKPLKRARTDKPDVVALDGSVATGAAVGSTPDAAIDVEAEWEARYGWRVEEAVASAVGVQVDVVRNVVDMLSKDCTIPFMARYRREQTGGLQADGLQNIQDTYTGLMQVKKKAQTMLQTLSKEKKGDADVRKLIISARSSVELDHLFAPYKESKGRSLAQRAKNLGLEETAQRILRGEATVESINPESLVKPDVKGLQSAKEVLLGWQHILADVLSKDRAVLDYLANASQNPGIQLTATKTASAVKLERQAHADGTPEISDQKYDNYANFCKNLRFVQPHQVLAINRGESQKVLSVKLQLPPNLTPGVKQFCESRLRSMGLRMQGTETAALVRAAVEDAYTRLLEPHLFRTIRSRLTKEAEKESVRVFRCNLRQLLLTPPVRGHAVLGIDPGFKHGCKLAAVSANGLFPQPLLASPVSP
ncbi:hypothetical protein HPB48_011946 [Haemaphysalis longicornis]|uniref:Uncharacterized protein n=1 Tax=Haemaphysalis longicornis TaxID=44386 RepID=A0A9J6H3F9_HAELO|nr:hypothetical protein HPB48_011946 [Haemaphysalis longicornis]